MKIELRLASADCTDAISLEVSNLVIAGWAARDAEAQEHHIRELEELGVKRPASTPTYYRVSAHRLTTEPAIECSGTASSGEAETVIFAQDGRLYVGLGSDHTDREVEAYGITVSKQMCDKPVASKFWDIETVADHWDQLILRSHIIENGNRVLYQEGSVAAMLSPEELLSCWNAPLENGTIMFCGTLAARGGIRPADRFEFELEDPVSGLRIAHAYDIKTLPLAG